MKKIKHGGATLERVAFCGSFWADAKFGIVENMVIRDEGSRE